jgi:hypothetical protein
MNHSLTHHCRHGEHPFDHLPSRRLGEQAGTSQTLLHALSTMLQLRRLSLSLCVALPPPPGARVASCGGKAAAGPQLEALDLWQVSFPDKGDDGRTLKVRPLPSWQDDALALLTNHSSCHNANVGFSTCQMQLTDAS